MAVFQDISALKRREVLEQVFFHDFLNTLGGIAGWTEMLQSSEPQSAAREIAALAESLKEEVLAQRTLLEAERGELAVTLSTVNAADLAAKLTVIFEHHPAAQGKRFVIRPLPTRRRVHSDPVLLLRVLVNMVKNAFEASDPGADVQVWLEWADAQPSFVVHNASVIPDRAREHIFERSFSTKATQGRGIGTYSMKLYGENYLRGAVTYTSDVAAGTMFRITLPPEADDVPDAPASSPSVAPASPARILLVDDSEPLLRLGTLMLTRLGYTVTGCRNGREALAALAAEREGYAAILTDWMMDGMDGGALIEAVSQQYPQLLVVVCSG